MIKILRFFRYGILLGIVGYGAFVNGFIFAYLIEVDKRYPSLTQLIHIAPWIILFSVLAFVVALVLRSHWLILGWMLPGALVFAAWYGGNFLPNFPRHPQGIEITVASFNAWGGHSDPIRVAQTIRAINADIIVVEEVHVPTSHELTTDLIGMYPYQFYQYQGQKAGVTLLSKYPILDSLTSERYIRTVIDVDGLQVVVYGFHAPNPGFQLGRGYDDSGNRFFVRQVAGELAQETLPVLMMCDCNATPQTRQHGWLDAVMGDAFQHVGWGFGFTHPGYYRLTFPAIRIDYVWYSDEFTPLSAEVWDDSGTSDHHPVRATLVLRDGE